MQEGFVNYLLIDEEIVRNKSKSHRANPFLCSLVSFKAVWQAVLD
jgi:hypothetical protein